MASRASWSSTSTGHSQSRSTVVLRRPYDERLTERLPSSRTASYPVLALARFNLYANSYGFLVKKSLAGRRNNWWWFEVAGIAVFWSWFGYGLMGGLDGGWKEKLAYLVVSHVCASPVHVQVNLSSAADGLWE